MRICTYNVRNLFLAGLGGEQGNSTDIAHSTKVPAEFRSLVKIVDKVAADVLCLQEVSTFSALHALNEALTRPFEHIEVLPGNSNRGIHLATMSRYPFELTSHRDLLLADESGAELAEYATQADAENLRPTHLRFQRDLLLAEIAVDSQRPLAIFNTHLKSKTNRPWRLLAADTIRDAESRTIRTVVSAYATEHADRPTVLLGDFNDKRSSDSVSRLFSMAFTDPLDAQLRRQGRNPSTYWPRRRMRIDHILLSARARDLLQKGSARIHASHAAKRASDHYPVSLELDLDKRR